MTQRMAAATSVPRLRKTRRGRTDGPSPGQDLKRLTRGKWPNWHRFKAHVGQLGVGKRFGAGLAVGLQFPAPAQAFKQGRREECHCRAASRARRGMSAREMPRSAMQQRDIRSTAEARRG